MVVVDDEFPCADFPPFSFCLAVLLSSASDCFSRISLRDELPFRELSAVEAWLDVLDWPPLAPLPKDRFLPPTNGMVGVLNEQLQVTDTQMHGWETCHIQQRYCGRLYKCLPEWPLQVLPIANGPRRVSYCLRCHQVFNAFVMKVAHEPLRIERSALPQTGCCISAEQLSGQSVQASPCWIIIGLFAELWQ